MNRQPAPLPQQSYRPIGLELFEESVTIGPRNLSLTRDPKTLTSCSPLSTYSSGKDSYNSNQATAFHFMLTESATHSIKLGDM